MDFVSEYMQLCAQDFIIKITYISRYKTSNISWKLKETNSYTSTCFIPCIVNELQILTLPKTAQHYYNVFHSN